MTASQSMSYAAVKAKTAEKAQKYGDKIKSGEWPLDVAHKMLLRTDGMTLFEIAGLAQAIACFQCSEE